MNKGSVSVTNTTAMTVAGSNTHVVQTRQRLPNGTVLERMETNIVQAILTTSTSHTVQRCIDRFRQAINEEYTLQHQPIGSLGQFGDFSWRRCVAEHHKIWQRLRSRCLEFKRGQDWNTWTAAARKQKEGTGTRMRTRTRTVEQSKKLFDKWEGKTLFIRHCITTLSSPGVDAGKLVVNAGYRDGGDAGGGDNSGGVGGEVGDADGGEREDSDSDTGEDEDEEEEKNENAQVRVVWENYNMAVVRKAMELVGDAFAAFTEFTRPPVPEVRSVTVVRSDSAKISSNGIMSAPQAFVGVKKIRIEAITTIPDPATPEDLLRLLSVRLPARKWPTKQAFEVVEDFLSGRFALCHEALLSVQFRQRAFQPDFFEWRLDHREVPKLTWHWVDEMLQSRDRTPKDHAEFQLKDASTAFDDHSTMTLRIRVPLAIVFNDSWALQHELPRDFICALNEQMQQDMNTAYEDEKRYVVADCVSVPLRHMHEDEWQKFRRHKEIQVFDDFGPPSTTPPLAPSITFE